MVLKVDFLARGGGVPSAPFKGDRRHLLGDRENLSHFLDHFVSASCKVERIDKEFKIPSSATGDYDRPEIVFVLRDLDSEVGRVYKNLDRGFFAYLHNEYLS